MRSKAIVLFLVMLVAARSSHAQDPASQPASPSYSAEKYRLVNQRDEIVSVLANGMTVIVKRVPSPAVAVRGVVGTGGAFEGKWLGGGLSHLLEHLVAGGSNERRSEAENRNLLQQIGNNSNAYTTEDRTAYFVNTTPPHMEKAIDLVTGWLLGAKITVPEYQREYQVVQRELEMGKGEPDRQFYYMGAMNRYRVNSARVPVIGFQEVIQGLSRDDVFGYYKLAYEPGNMVFSVVGDLDPETMLATLRKYVTDAKPARVFSHDIAPEPPVLAPRTLVATFPKLGQARLQLGFPSIKLDHPDLYALDLLATIVGSGDGSLLVQELRDARQLVSAVSAFDDTPTYVDGTFAVQLQLDADKVDPATRAVLELLEQFKTRPIDAQRIGRAKTQLKVARVKSLQTVEQISTSLVDDFMSAGDPHFGDRYVERIERVTAEQLQDVARRYLDRGRLLTTLLLPSEAVGAAGLPRAEDLIRPAAPTTRPGAKELASDVQRFELDNGVIVLLKRIATSPLVTFNMFSLGGVTAEDDATNGIGNLAMRMLPRGTATRNAQQIAEFFDSVGGELESGCGNNSWLWTASCLTADFERTLNVYADVVNHPSFADAELPLMKQRVAAAIDGQDAEWTSQSLRFFKQVYYGPQGSPYRFMAIGTKKNLEKFIAEDLRRWYAQKVLASRRVLAIYGDIDLAQSRALVSAQFGGGMKLAVVDQPAPAAAHPISEPPVGLPSVDVTEVKVQRTEQELAGVVIGFRSGGVIGESAEAVLDVGQTMAGGWGYPTGYLFETLRGQGLVYIVQAQNNPGRSARFPGTFFVFAGCDPSKVNEVIDQSLLNIARLQGTPADVQEDWFHRSKLLVATSDALEHETPAQQASAAALNELLRLGYDHHRQFPARINAVSLDQVRQAAATRLRQCVVTVCTPDPDSVKVKTGVRTYGTFPPVDLTPRGVQHDTSSAKP